jgi:hypothetical protein
MIYLHPTLIQRLLEGYKLPQGWVAVFKGKTPVLEAR